MRRATGPNEGNPITRFLERQGSMVLDGGLATTLEAYGCNLDDDLWSARMLLEAPEQIGRVHHDFLTAGADCITTSTYQASFDGFHKRGLGEGEARELFDRSVRLAVDARDRFWQTHGDRPGRLRPLVAASIGPYGAYLADGSEYKGHYDIDDAGLRAFHEGRWKILAGSPVDLLACETIPSRQEAAVLLELLYETPDRWAWMSFSCRDGRTISDGTPIADVAGACDAVGGVAAVGVNCTSPEFVSSLIDEVKRVTEKPVIVYPNSGERYDRTTRRWIGARRTGALDELALEWVQRGAACIGGCCRIGPGVIADIRRRLVG